ncbi:MAG: membrane integrity-associated transporter subunit PqiC [Bdellovibrio bacteriovorus]
MIGRLTIAALLGAWILGCASTPARFYTLSAELPPAAQAPRISVVVGPVSIPSDVDRPQMVLKEGPNQVRIDEDNRWAAPLADAITSVVAENLAALLGTPRVTVFPDRIAGDGAYGVTIEVQQFVSEPGSAATLSAVWTVRRGADGRTETGRTRVREPVKGSGYEDLAAAHSRALGTLSRQIADTLEALSAGDSGRSRSRSL